jgi:hypothetical protein
MGGFFLGKAAKKTLYFKRMTRNSIKSRGRKTALAVIPPVLAWLLFASCATLSPVPPAETPADLSPQWLPLPVDLPEAEGAPAAAYFAGRIKSPQVEFWALRIDLRDPALVIVVNGPEALEGRVREGYIPSTTVSGFVKTYGCLAGINANPFSPASGKTGEERLIDGIGVSEGRLVSRPHHSFDALVFYDHGGAAMVNQADLSGEGLRGVRNAVGGFYRVLEKGAVPEGVLGGGQARHPRSAAGLSADGRYLYLLAADGRRPGSVGLSLAELGRVLRGLGASEGLNFDGGGSTALALGLPGGKVRLLNTPVHNRIPGKERGVALCLGLRAAARP